MDAVAVDDGHRGIANHIAHTATTEHGAVNQQTGLLFGVEIVFCRRVLVLVRVGTISYHLIHIFGIIIQVGEEIRGHLPYTNRVPSRFTLMLFPIDDITLSRGKPRHRDTFVSDYRSGSLPRVMALGFQRDHSRTRLRRTIGISNGKRNDSGLMT